MTPEEPRESDLRGLLRPVDGLVEQDGAVEAAVAAPLRPDVTGVDPHLGPVVDLAVSDLAQRLGVDAEQVDVIVAAAVTWPDRSCGCPQPGMAYPQVTVDGAYIVLATRGQTYRYHGGGSRQPFLCERQ